MRQFSKIALLLAPILLGASGCATQTGSYAQQQPTSQSSSEDRFDRLLRVARKYEDQGKPEVARRLYEQILAQTPENPVARSRIEVIDAVQQTQQLAVNQPVKPRSTSSQAPVKQPASTPARSVAARPEPSSPRPEPEAVVAQTNLAKPQTVQEKTPEVRQELPQQPIAQAPTSVSVAKKAPSQNMAIESPVAKTHEETPDFFQLLQEKQRREAQRLASVQQANVPGVVQLSKNPRPVETTVSVETVAQTEPAKVTKADQPAVQPKPTRQVTNSGGPTLVDLPTPDDEAALAASQLRSTPAIQKWTDPSRDDRETVTLTTLAKTTVFEAASLQPTPTNVDVNTRLQPTGEKIVPVRRTVVSKPLQTVITARPVPKIPELSRSTLPAHLIPAVTQLSSPKPQTRIEGLIKLGTHPQEALAATFAVRNLLNDPDPLVRTHATGTLYDLTGNTTETVNHLQELLTEENAQVVQLTSYLLGQIGPDAIRAVSSLDQTLRTRNGMTQLHAAEAITKITPSDPQAFQVLKDALSAARQQERYLAAVALGGVSGQLRQPTASLLRVALHDDDADVRAAAALSLGAMGPYALVAIEDLEHMAQYDYSDVKISAQTSLACLAEYR